MVNAAAAIDTGSTSSPLYTRAASANAVLSSEASAPVTSPQASESKVVNLSETLRFNSFEFSYRPDFGKIVLLRQEPETGEVVQQFPTDYYLEKYAESERATRQARPAANDAQSESNVVTAPTRQPANGASAGGADVAPVVASAPALPSGGVSSSAGTARVDITV
ncbi:hypothetical protein [Dongia sp.]|uniref:hypothetical protein n=1 Tax=Dongia sp. TaxID=1977262 RepID=UPI0035B1018E